MNCVAGMRRPARRCSSAGPPAGKDRMTTSARHRFGRAYETPRLLCAAALDAAVGAGSTHARRPHQPDSPTSAHPCCPNLGKAWTWSSSEPLNSGANRAASARPMTSRTLVPSRVRWCSDDLLQTILRADSHSRRAGRIWPATSKQVGFSAWPSHTARPCRRRRHRARPVPATTTFATSAARQPCRPG